MKIDNAIREFVESVSREALASIDTLSKERGLVLTGATMPAFVLKESCDKFAEYIDGYANYKIRYANDSRASSQQAIHESTDKFISSNQLFQESQVRYSDIPAFIQSYVSGIQTVLEAVNRAKSKMSEADVDQESIGDINEFADKFMDRLDGSFKPWMEKVLWASGYMTEQYLFGKKEKSEPKPVFL